MRQVSCIQEQFKLYDYSLSSYQLKVLIVLIFLYHHSLIKHSENLNGVLLSVI